MSEEDIINSLYNLIVLFGNYSTDFNKKTCDHYKEVFIEIKKQLEEKDEVIKKQGNLIDEAIDYIKENTKICYSNKQGDNSIIGHFMWNTDKLSEILERGKSENNTN